MTIEVIGKFKNGKIRSVRKSIEKGLTKSELCDILEIIESKILCRNTYYKYEVIHITIYDRKNSKLFKIKPTSGNYNKTKTEFNKDLINILQAYYEGGLFDGKESMQSRSTDSVRTTSQCNSRLCGQGNRQSEEAESKQGRINGNGQRFDVSDGICEEAEQKDDSIRLLLSKRPLIATADKFKNAMKAFSNSNENAQAVEIHDLKDYKNMVCMLYDNDNAGIAVQKSGNIVSVFKSNKSSIKGFATLAVKDAIANGGKKLDCYSTRNKLPNAYMQAGMRPICKIKFNREFAHNEWDYARDGEPDIVFMALGDNLYDRYENYTDKEVPYITDSKTKCAYDIAEEYRDDWIKKHYNKIDASEVDSTMALLGKLLNKLTGK